MGWVSAQRSARATISPQNGLVSKEGYDDCWVWHKRSLPGSCLLLRDMMYHTRHMMEETVVGTVTDHADVVVLWSLFTPKTASALADERSDFTSCPDFND